MKKIVLIEPQSKEDHVYKHVRMPRLGLPILGTQLREAGYEVKLYMGTGESLPWAKILDADLVGISTTTATCREAYQIAGLLRANGTPVVIGGIHATFMPEEALQFADYIVSGEADETFLDLVGSIDEGRPPQGIPGVSYWLEGAPVHNPKPESWVDLDGLPIPDLTLLERSSSMLSTPVMTSRGCPFNCTFCCVTKVFGRRYRHRTTESVLEELSLYRGRNIFFCDDNFTANPKRTKELLKGVIDRGIKLKRWGAQVRVDAVEDDELLDLMRRSGCGIVYIGFESINPATLNGYNKQQTVEDIRRAITRFHDYGIRIHGMFVFGGDSDTVDTIRQTVDFALESRIDSVQFMTLTPFPGTPFYEELEKEGRILSRDWSLYDGHHTVFQPALMSPAELQSETVAALKKFYSLKNVLQNYLLTGRGSVIHRLIGWGLSRHFDRQNRWYARILEERKYDSPRPVTLLHRSLPVQGEKRMPRELYPSTLRVTLTEKKGILYLKLRGIAGNLQLREIKRSLKGLLPEHYGQMVVDTGGLRFASEKAASSFGAYLHRLGSKVRRLQVVAPVKAEGKCFIGSTRKSRLRLPRFELLLQRR